MIESLGKTPFIDFQIGYKVLRWNTTRGGATGKAKGRVNIIANNLLRFEEGNG